MTHTARLLHLADAYCAASGRSRARLSTIIFNDGKRLDLIAAGGDLNTRSWERAMSWFVANWPEGTQWPDEEEKALCAVLGRAAS